MSHFAVVVRLTFPEYKGRKAFVLKSVNSFRVENSWEALTDTAEIVIAKKLSFEDKGKVFELIKTGCPILLEGGYDGEYKEEFRGYVAKVLDDMPVVLKCEDNMYVLKRTAVHFSKSKITLKELLKEIVPAQFEIDCADVDLGSVLFRKTTVSQVLQKLKDDYGLYSYFVGNTLVSGKVYTNNVRNQVVNYSMFGVRKNIIDNTLKYRNKEDYDIRVTMNSHMSYGTKKSVTVGDEGGQEITLICSNISDVATIKALATQEYERLKVDGYEGSLITFARPFIKQGDTAVLENKEYPEKGGGYYADAVTTTLTDMGAYHRNVQLGRRAATQ
jgi:hypothetical protein